MIWFLNLEKKTLDKLKKSSKKRKKEAICQHTSQAIARKKSSESIWRKRAFSTRSLKLWYVCTKSPRSRIMP